MNRFRHPAIDPDPTVHAIPWHCGGVAFLFLTGTWYSNNVILMDSEFPKCVQARRRARTMVGALVKHGNAAWAHLGGSLRAGLEGIIHSVASVGKGTPFPARRALWLTPSRPAEPINITLLEY